MALSNRFIFEFRSVRYSELFTITILKDGYVGSAENIAFAIGRDFVILSYDKNEINVLHPLRGAQCRLRLSLTAAQIEEFLTADARDFQINIQGTNLNWTGWYQPQVELNYNPFKIGTIDLQFTDISGLKSEKDSVLDTAFIEQQPLGDMVERQINYLGLGLAFDWSSSIEHADYIGDHVKDVVHLEQSVTLEKDGKLPQDCYTLLTKELRLAQSALFQRGGEWKIWNLIDKGLAATNNFFASLLPVERGVNVVYRNAIAQTTTSSYHYEIRHTQPNRDFATWVLDLPLDWEVSDPTYDFCDQQTVSGKNYVKVWGNYTAGDASTRDWLSPGDVYNASEGDTLRVFFQYEITRPADNPDPQIAVECSAAPSFWLREDGTWIQQASAYIITGAANIADILNKPLQAPSSGGVVFRIYRPYVDGASFDVTKSYMRVGYVDVIATNTSLDYDYKVYKSIANVDSKSIADPVDFETIGLQTDTEFYPAGAATFIDYERYVTPMYNPAGGALTSEWTAPYMDETTFGLTSMFNRAYSRLYDKPYFVIEATVIGQNLNIGDAFTVTIPGLPSGLKFVVVAFDYDIKQDRYTAILSQVPDMTNPSETHKNEWLRIKESDT